MTPSELYEPFIERNLVAVPAALRAYREEHGSEETFLAVGRFAVLAYAPSQHAKHALLCCLAAYDLRRSERFDAIVDECAIYAAGSRQPWSEPPILKPPDVEGEVPETFDDRVSAERWLAARLDSRDLFRDDFTAAAHDFEDLGHKLIVSAAAWRLVPILGEQGRYATLRVGVWEDVAYGGERYEERGPAPEEHALVAKLIDNMVAEKGNLEAAHALFLLDAARVAPSKVRARAFDYLSNVATGFSPSRDGLKPVTTSLIPYRLARDYGECLKAHAIAKRLPRGEEIIAAAHYNLEHAPSYEDWSFA